MGWILSWNIWDQLLLATGELACYKQGKHGSALFSIATFEQVKVKNMNFQTCYTEIWTSMADFDISNTRSTVSG